MSGRKETIRPGLEIDFDLLDSDRIRSCMIGGLHWSDGPPHRFWWTHYMDEPDWVEGDASRLGVMAESPQTERQWGEYRRFLRLLHYKSYPDIATLATRPADDPGEFVIRKPAARFGAIQYVYNLEEDRMPPGFADPDSPEDARLEGGFMLVQNVDYAQRFSHADAIRLCVRIMEVLGQDIAGDYGDYFEPIHFDVAKELHDRARRRPRDHREIYRMVNDVSREP
jgi:hypothetical protein